MKKRTPILDIKPRAASLDGLVYYFHGDLKVGKTSLASQFPKPFFLRFEVGDNMLDGTVGADIKDWSDVEFYVDQLCNPTVRENFETVVFDTADAMYHIASRWILEETGASNLKDAGAFGQGYQMVANKIKDALDRITKYRYTIVITGHSNAETDPDTGRVQVQPKLSKSGTYCFLSIADVILHLKREFSLEQDNPLMGNFYALVGAQVSAGAGRGRFVKGDVEITYDKLIQYVKDAAETGNKATTGRDVVVQKSEVLEIPVERDLDDIKQSIRNKVIELSETSDMLAAKVEALVGTMLEGRSITEATDRRKLEILEEKVYKI